MKISSRDWVLLSAYLDGELSPQKTRQLERRIGSDPILSDALDQLRAARNLLRQAPRLSTPRDFRLTSRMVGSPARARPALGLRLAAAAMSFLFVAVVVLDLGRGFLGGAMAPAAPRELMVEEAADYSAEVAEEAAPPAVDAEPPAEMAADDAAGENRAEGESSADSPDPAADQVAEAEELAAAEEKSTADQAVQATAGEGEEEQDAPVTETSPPPPSPTSPPPQPQPEEYQPPEPTRALPVPSTRLPIFTILEIVLGISAVSLWIAARRRSR